MTCSNNVAAQKHHSRRVRVLPGAHVADSPQARIQGPREQSALHRQERRMQLVSQEHPRAGQIPAGRGHYFGGSQMAFHPGDFLHDVPVQLAAVRYVLVAGGLCARRSEPYP